MKKFEYKTVPFIRKFSLWKDGHLGIQELENILTQMGNEGWELTTSVENKATHMNLDIVLIFKREILEK